MLVATTKCFKFALSQGPLSDAEAFDFSSLDFENDVLNPDWKLMETEGILPTLREAKSRFYADGSAPKIRTALNRWRRYVKTKARVSFIRPRIGDDPERFMTESILRQGFIAFCVSGGCSVETVQSSMLRCSMAGTSAQWATVWCHRARFKTSSFAEPIRVLGECFRQRESIVRHTRPRSIRRCCESLLTSC